MKDIRQLYEDLHSTEQDRINREIEDNFRKRVQQERRKVTLLGHLRQPGGLPGGFPGGFGQTLFSEVTSKFLDVTDLIKVLALSKQVRRTALKYNPGLFISLHSSRINLLIFRVKEWTDNSALLRRQIYQLEQREKARNQMLQNVTD